MLESRIFIKLILGLFVLSQHATAYQQFKSNFKSCCSFGRDAFNSQTDCADFSQLPDKSSGCKFAFTVCCSQTRKTSECDRGRRHALAGKSCNDLKRDATCDEPHVIYFKPIKNNFI